MGQECDIVRDYVCLLFPQKLNSQILTQVAALCLKGPCAVYFQSPTHFRGVAQGQLLLQICACNETNLMHYLSSVY
jgi:hypothetical protein